MKTTERYDHHGRLIEVVEPSQGLNDVSTYYDYDVGGRLKRAFTDAADPVLDQTRCWDYDQRGFLNSEDHPEIIGGTAGDVVYSSYDSMGHAKQRFEGTGSTQAALGYDFDAAARLVAVWDLRTSSPSDDRKMKEWIYATANSGTNKRKAKVQIASGYNYPILESGPVDSRFDEIFEYTQPGGRLGKRTVNFLAGPTFGQQDRFSHSEVFDERGQRTGVSMPVCEPAVAGFCDSANQQPLTIASSYDSGFLTGVTGWANTITYHSSGLWNTVTHSNGATDTQSDDNRRPRPLTIVSTSGATTLYRSGTFVYDAAGNIYALGKSGPGFQLNTFGGRQISLRPRRAIALCMDGDAGRSDPGLRNEPLWKHRGDIDHAQWFHLQAVCSRDRPSDESPYCGERYYDSRGNLTQYSATPPIWDALN
ncbi:MAG: hypothetical protein R2862_08420 [Thermoanaerobaculia bacterium]